MIAAGAFLAPFAARSDLVFENLVADGLLLLQQVGDLIGREESEASMAGGDAGDVRRRVMVGGDNRRVAYPDAWLNRSAEKREGVVLFGGGQCCPRGDWLVPMAW